MAEAAVQISSLFDEVPVADLGTISIRTFVLPPKLKKGAGQDAVLPIDADDGEIVAFEQPSSTPVSSYLEASRGRRCVVFLVVNAGVKMHRLAGVKMHHG